MSRDRVLLIHAAGLASHPADVTARPRYGVGLATALCIGLLLVVFTLRLTVTVGADPATSVAAPASASVADAVARFGDPDWQVRRSAFQQVLDAAVPGGFQGRTWLLDETLPGYLARAPQADQLRLGLKRLMTTEMVRVKSGARVTATYANYVADLAAAIAATGDRTAAPVLTGVIALDVATTQTVAARR